MCGFLGVGGKSYYENNFKEINDAFNWLKHRGPDETTKKIIGDFFLGFHRLAIVGVKDKNSSQPITLKRKNIEMMFNGEIFNYKDLAKKNLDNHLKNLKSDSMVLAELIDKFEFSCLDLLDGMFSIALIDPTLKKIILIRDRYGIKPLYYSIQNGNFIFSSHIKPILEITNYRKPNKNAIFEYLNSGLYDHSEQTFFDGIFAVPPGQIIEFDLNSNSLKKTKWYEIRNYLELQERKNKKELTDEVESVIKDVINDYIPQEVDFTINVSGGVDSTLLVDSVKKFSNNNFLIQNQDYEGQYSESPWIDEYCKILNINPKYHLITPEYIADDLHNTFEYQSQPFGGVTVPGYSPLYKHAKNKKCKVVLDGTGLDEAFLGYPRYGEGFINNKNKFWRSSLKGSTGPTDKKGIRPNAISDNLSKNANPLESFSSFLEGNSNLPPSRYMSLLDLTSDKIPRTTRFTDHASSRFSQELRTPFLSHKLMHLGFSIPNKYLISEKGTKLIIRELLSKRGLGKIGNAPKRYIQSPQNEWIAKEFRPMIQNFLFSDHFLEQGWLKPEIVKKEYEEYINSEKSNSFFIWQWFSLAYWSKLNFI